MTTAEETRYHFVQSSKNVKTGPIPVTMSTSNTCPDTCGARGVCYAKSGNTNIFWTRLNKGVYKGLNITELAAKIKALPKGQLWRMNVAGDLPGCNSAIDTVSLSKIIRANKGKRGFTYTHKPVDNDLNRTIIKESNVSGFTINLSADTIENADKLKALNIGPVVSVLPHDCKENFLTPQGNKVVICPAVQKENINCSNCQLCARPNRSSIIGFPLHGSTSRNQEKVKLLWISRQAD